jgi:hypothetical protein
VGKRRLLRYTWTQSTQSQRCTEQGLLISVRSGVNARAVAAAHQSSRSACQVSRSGLGRSALFAALSPFTASNVVTLSTTGYRRIRPLVQRPPVRNLACSRVPLRLRDQPHKRPLRTAEALEP